MAENFVSILLDGADFIGIPSEFPAIVRFLGLCLSIVTLGYALYFLRWLFFLPGDWTQVSYAECSGNGVGLMGYSSQGFDRCWILPRGQHFKANKEGDNKPVAPFEECWQETSSAVSEWLVWHRGNERCPERASNQRQCFG